MEVCNRKLTLKQFKKQQVDVLASWSTGADVNFDEAVKYHESIPEHKRFCTKLVNAKKAGITLVQPRAGVALLDQHIELLKYLEKYGEADLLPTTIDSYTRHNKYSEAQYGITDSHINGRSMLNGFPAVNYGITGCKRVIEECNAPVQIRHGTPDARLLAEITLAGGFTSFEGGGISYNIPYSKKSSLEQTIRDWQYVDRLVGLYEEEDISINREPFGPLTGTLIPPCISHAVAIIESLLAAEQGVKNITVGYGQCGNIVQDVAAIKTLDILVNEYLKKYGHDDVVITTVLHQWMGGFPTDEAKAYGVISLGAVTAALSNVTKVIVKTPHEASGIPTKEANAQGIRTTKQIIKMLIDQKMPVGKEVIVEENVILSETRAIVDKALQLGDEDIAVGVIRAFEAGTIDVPFAPSKFNAGLVLPVRDNNGAIRFLEFGNLPFDDDIKAFHRKKIRDRAKAEGREASFQMVIDDITAVSKGRLVGR